MPLLIPSRLQGHELAASWTVTMKHKHVICHAIDQREGYLITSQSQVRRQVKKVIGGLVPVSTGQIWMQGQGRYHVRREHGYDLIINHRPQMARQFCPRNRLDVFKPSLTSQAILSYIGIKFLHRVAGQSYASRLRDVQAISEHESTISIFR